jgi:chromosomal replication initiation ATPase DnaA
MKKQIFNQYAQKIADLFGIDKHELFIKSKKRDLVDARHLLYYLCFHRPMQLVSIQNFMEENGYNISHPSVIHGVSIVSQRVAEDADYTFIIKSIEKSVNN